MMRTGSTIARRLLAGGVAAGAITAMAQAGQAVAAEANPPSQAAQTVQEVVVTANKRAEKLHDVAMGVTALTGNQLDVQQNVSFTDYAGLIPGLSLQAGGPGSTRLTLRGENAGGIGSTVAVYIDESPFGSSNALADGAVTTGDFETFDLQRVEVLRGPQGTLYGASTEGGLLKFVQNAPNPSAFSAKAEVGGESVDHGQTAGSVKGMVNLPLAGGKAALRVSAYEESLPGYINDPRLGLKNVNSGNKYGWRAAFLWKPTETLTVKLSGVQQLLRSGDNPLIDVEGAANPAHPPANQLSPVAGDLSQNQYIHGYIKNRIENYSGTVTWSPGPVSVTSVTSYGVLKMSTNQDLTSLAYIPGVLTYGDVASLFIYGKPVGLSETQLNDLHKFTQELRIASGPSERLEWQIGGFYTREATDIAQTIPVFKLSDRTPVTSPPGGGADLAALYKEWAGFGELTYHFNKQFDIALGGRYSSNTQSAVVLTSAGALTGPSNTSFNVASTGSDFTWSVAPRWHVDNNTMVYGRVATGYRPGGPNDVPSSSPSTVPRTYRSDSTTNYELGVRSTLLDNRLSVDVAAFYIDWKDIQLREVVGVYGINGNGGAARSEGVEWTFGLNPIRGLTLNLTGSYVSAELTKLGGAGVEAAPGDRLPFVPDLSGALDGQYEWPALADFNGFVGGTLSYIGERYTDFAPTGSANVSHVKLPSYDTLALRAGLQNERWRFELYAKNLTDERGLNVYTSSGAPGFHGTASIIQPRTVGLVLSRKF